MHIAHQLAKVSLGYDALCIHALDLRRRLPAPATDPFRRRIVSSLCGAPPHLASPRLAAWAGQEPPNSMSRRECDVGDDGGHAFDRGLRPRLYSWSSGFCSRTQSKTYGHLSPASFQTGFFQVCADRRRSREGKTEREKVCVCMARATKVRLVRGRRTVTNVRNAFLTQTYCDLTSACGLPEVAHHFKTHEAGVL